MPVCSFYMAVWRSVVFAGQIAKSRSKLRLFNGVWQKKRLDDAINGCNHGVRCDAELFVQLTGGRGFTKGFHTNDLAV